MLSMGTGTGTCRYSNPSEIPVLLDSCVSIDILGSRMPDVLNLWRGKYHDTIHCVVGSL